MPIRLDLFNRRVNTEGPTPPTLDTPCHLWTGAQRRGRSIYNKQLAHFVIWKYYNGPIAGGQHLYHRCSQSLCVNPAHLELGTQIHMGELDARMRARARGERTHLQ